jgi:putative phage-type endonuclease
MEEFYDLCLYIVDCYVQPNLIDFYKESFHTSLNETILLFLEYYILPHLNIDNDTILDVIEFSTQFYFDSIFIQRHNSHYCPTQDIESIIKHISSKPQPIQRTMEWYMFRHNMITASSASKAFGTTANINELICSKCSELDMNKYKLSLNTDGAMHWGVKYEPVSVEYYEYIHQTKISEYGCITHDTIPYLAASPDGINTIPDHHLYGRMLEIKNPYTREITGIPKDDYWVQCQLQMEVCQLDYCDFLETKFIEYESEESFNADGTFLKSEDDKFKGIIMYFANQETFLYEYLPFQSTYEDYVKWEEEMMEKHTNDMWIKTIYWKLEKVSCVLIQRNKEWLHVALTHLESIWNIIQVEKENGKWIERLPKKRINLQKEGSQL